MLYHECGKVCSGVSQLWFAENKTHSHFHFVFKRTKNDLVTQIKPSSKIYFILSCRLVLVTECIKESELESEVTRFGVGGA